MKSLFPQPFEPEDGKPDPSKRRRLRDIPLRMLIPSIITLAGLYAGLTAIRMAFEGRFEFAAGLIVLAGVLDAVDGRAARLLKSTSRFGAELDSLADFVNFGVAPAILLYAWVLDELGASGWIGAILFATCIVLRLARFNVMMDDPGQPEWKANFFVGMPAPAAAGTVMLPLYLGLAGVPYAPQWAPFVLAYVLIISYLSVSRIPTFSGKKMGTRVPREYVIPLFGGVVLFVALAASFLWEVLAAMTIIYLAAIPIGRSYYNRLEAKEEKQKAEQADAEKGKGGN